MFFSSRNPYSGRYSGDVIRSLRIINLLKKKFKLDIVYLKKSNEPNFNLKNTQFLHENSFYWGNNPELNSEDINQIKIALTK